MDVASIRDAGILDVVALFLGLTMVLASFTLRA
jgi:hypothetical protein